MKTIQLNARYGYIHSLNHIGNDLWIFQSDPKSYGTYRVIGFEGEHEIGNYVYALDPEGGPFLSVGDKIKDYTIKSITQNGIFELIKDNENENN
jgi:hypothetical protein